MSFSNWQEFLAMGGYGFYVWASFGLTALVLGTVMLVPLQRHRALQRDLFRQARRSARENNS